MNWMWGWPETVGVTNDTFTTVLRLMDEFPDFKYTQSQASVYEIVRVHNPELFERVKARVREGRWEVAASHWVEGDKNMASGEALARHLLYTRAYFGKHFGLAPDDVIIDWSPDTFGHARSIPSIDSRGAVRRYYMCRGGDGSTPPIFWWTGPDGCRVLVYRDIRWYNGAIQPACTDALLEFHQATGLRDYMLVYGVGDHGGGPTRRDILRCREMDSWPIYPRFQFALSRDFFDIVEANGHGVPVVDGELNCEFSGCYTSQSEIKKNNRYGENACAEAEICATLAHTALGCPYPADTLRQAWIDVLFSHFHDILPGSGVRDTRTFNQGSFQRLAAATGQVKTQALRALAAHVDTSFAKSLDAIEAPPELQPIALGGGAGRGSAGPGISDAGHTPDAPRPFVVFNPSTWPRTEVVRATVWDAQSGMEPADIRAKSWMARLPDGTRIPAQVIGTGDYWGHRFVDVAFPVTVGPMGYAACSVEEGGVGGSQPAVRVVAESEGKDRVNLPAGRLTMENEFLRVEFDKRSGGIFELLDKRSGVNLASPDDPLGVLEFVLERPQAGSAWIMGSPRRTICPLELHTLGVGVPGGWTTDTSGCGPHIATVTAKGVVEGSAFTVHYEIKAGQPRLDITVETRWTEIGSPEKGTPRLNMRFPVALAGVQARYEIPFGCVERSDMNGRDVPALRWMDVSNAAAGLAILNDSKYGHSLKGSVARVSLIRSTYEPDPLPEVGDHTIRLAVVPHGPGTTVDDLVRLGAAFNHPLIPVGTDVHTGDLPASIGSGALCEPSNVIVTQLKRAEDGEGIVFRLQECGGRATKAAVMLESTLFGRVVSATEVDLLERPVRGGSAIASPDGFAVQVSPRGICSVRVVLRRD